MKTGIISSKNSLNHDTGDEHPENKYRIQSILERLKKIKSSNLEWSTPNKFDESYLKKTHNNLYIEEVKKAFPKKGKFFLDGDTVISPGSKNASYDAVSSIISAIDLVKKKKLKNAFCAVRPPGHHAEYDKAMGFCIFNNVAVGANYLIERYKLSKIAIIDFDVHHGNGTQNIFYSNKKVLYISTHQYPHFPGTGASHEKGSYNNIFNIPLPAGTNSNEYFDAYEHVLKKLNQFKPEFIFFSAGFDAHKDDPLSNINLKSKDYFEITKRTLIASKDYCKGNVVSILEGGYDLNALAESTEEHINALIKF
ncbi:MAG: histone deacetylase family protein [Pseudomonadota bacterium]|nr:histone deacetylase family protein [Pseudomonadota bacterium]